MDISSQIEVEQQKLDNATSDYQKLQLTHNIIELKKLSNNPNTTKSIYLDCKSFLKLAVSSIDEPNFGYFNLNPEKVKKIMSSLTTEEKLSLQRNFMKDLKENGFEENLGWLTSEIKRNEIRYYIQNVSLKNICKLIATLSSFNVFTLAISIAIIFVVYSVILLPAPHASFAAFDVSFKKFSENNFLNHIANSFLLITSLDDDVKMQPTNLKGIAGLILIKAAIILFLLNFLLEEIKSKIKF
jgi:hypothetical protein